MFRFGSRSEERLLGVHPDLVKVVRKALEISKFDFAVVEGLRTKERQVELYAQGRTKPGKIVTWTLNSRHITGHAVDLVPINPETARIDWNLSAGFAEISRAMFASAAELNVKIVWGKDWDSDGIIGEKNETDTPHFELDRRVYS